MKKFNLPISIAIGASLLISSCTQEEKNSPEEKAVVSTQKGNEFDPALATELGADDYGMKHYVMAFLKRGPNQNQSPEEVQRLQRAHMDNIGRLAEQRKLVVAGPFMDDTELRGVYIFDVETVEEAEELTKTDPAITAGRLIMELHPWYGSAALIKSAEIHKTISKKEI